MIRRSLGALTIVLVVILGCDSMESFGRRDDGFVPPATFEVQRRGNRLEIQPPIGTPWDELIDMSLFADFATGMTIREARDELGEPTRQGRTRRGQYWDYEKTGGTVRLAHNLRGSFPFLRWWRMYGFPNDTRPPALFSPLVLKHLPLGESSLELVILNNEGRPGVVASLQDGAVSRLSWVNNPGSGGTLDRERKQ